MLQYKEFEGKNVAKAIEKACEELRVPRKELKHDVLSYGSTGIFGLSGSKQARIRVVVPESMDPGEKKGAVRPSDCFTAQTDTGDISEKIAPAEVFDCFVDERAGRIETVSEDTEEHVDPGAVLAGKEALQKIVDALTDESVISSKRMKNQIVYHIDGGNAAVLIGKHGQTLEAIKAIVEKIVNKTAGNRIYVQVDIGDYLEKRQQNLERMAKSSAEKASRTGKPVCLGQMNARDRRIVHLTLKDDKAVKTQSMGDGHIRKLMVFPKKRNHS